VPTWYLPKITFWTYCRVT